MFLAAIRLGDNRSSFFFGMSIRMALGLNICIDPDIEEVHGSQAWLRKEAQRRLWWMLSSLDTLDIPHSLPQLISTSDRPTITAMPVLLGSHNGRTRIPAPDAMWEAVRKEDNLPAVGLFTHGHDLNIADASARLIRLHGKLQEFGLSISQTFHRALNAQPRWLAVGGRGTNTSNTGAGVRYPKHSNVSRNNSLSSSRHTIEKELQDWFHYLPLWARNIDHSDSFSYSPYSQNPPPWHLLNLHLIHHAIYIAVSIPIWLEAARPLSSEHDYRATPNDFHTADKSRPHGATSFPEPTASRTLNHRTLHHLAASVEAETSERSTPSSIEGKADMRRPRQHPLDPPTAGSQHFHPSILNSPQPHTTSTSYTTADCFSHDPELVQRYNYARRHCRWTSDKILLIRRLDPQLQQVSVLALYFTFYSALFIAFEVIYNEATSLKSPLGYASNPSLHELHQDLETHLSWFSAHGRRCHLGTHLYQLINKFLADHRCQYPNVYTS
ncbi:hypothetical protein DFS34DRAFT_334526 [Phlyctochytrium arcticum]|nr:hypothetical protein DFS34DRAFT_334526 [Phlyctochytrium arcticum]